MNALPAVNFTVFAAGMVMVSPVDGLRPVRSARAPAESDQLNGIATRDARRHGLEDRVNGLACAGLAFTRAGGDRIGILLDSLFAGVFYVL